MNSCGFLFSIFLSSSLLCQVGPDGTVADASVYDEIADYLNGRYISSVEACWRIFEFPMHGASPPVERLAVHLPGDEITTFVVTDGDDPADVRGPRRTTLTAWFLLNEEDSSAREHLYADIPHHYTWHTTRVWRRRERALRHGACVLQTCACPKPSLKTCPKPCPPEPSLNALP